MTHEKDALRAAAESIYALRALDSADVPLEESWPAEFQALGAALAEPQPNAAADGWMPIETAPKDGTPLLLRSSKGRIADGCWMAATNSVGAWMWAYVKLEPTHWRPLPAPPTLSASKEG